MPTRRTSPRRSATRPGASYERPIGPMVDDFEDEPRSGLAAAAPWISVLALVLAAIAVGFVIIRPSGSGSAGGADACRSAAWSAIPDEKKLPTDWSLGSTDLNANGMTISVTGPVSADGTTDQPVIYASITCYGDSAEAALEAYRTSAQAAGATVTARTADEAYDVTNQNTGSTTTFFRVGGLIAQIADAGTASQSDLATITGLVASAMGEPSAAGAGLANPSDAAGGPDASDVAPSDEPAASAFAPELEAVFPKSIPDPSSTASPPAEIALTVQSASATDVFGEDPSSRALAARIRSLGSSMDKLQIAQAYDETGAIDLSVIGFRLPGGDVTKLRAAIIDTWLAASGEGVKNSQVTLGGKTVTKVDYGDGSTIEYVYAKADYVIVIDTSDAQVATEIAAKLP